MTQTQIQRILSAHCVSTKTLMDGAILAYDVVIAGDGSDASQWVDVTGWTATRLYAWLGY